MLGLKSFHVGKRDPWWPKNIKQINQFTLRLFLTRWGLGKGFACSCILLFSKANVCISIQISLIFILMGPMRLTDEKVISGSGNGQAPSQYLNQWRHSSLMHMICNVRKKTQGLRSESVTLTKSPLYSLSKNVCQTLASPLWSKGPFWSVPDQWPVGWTLLSDGNRAFMLYVLPLGWISGHFRLCQLLWVS